MEILSGIAVQSRNLQNSIGAVEESILTMTPANGTLPPCALFPVGLKGPYK